MILGVRKGQRRILSPFIIRSMQRYLPACNQSGNVWRKYSLVENGASMRTFLAAARGAKYSLICIETADGEIFGAFTSEPWRKNSYYFGGRETFLWPQQQDGTKVEVFSCAGDSSIIQLCSKETIAVGGGTGAPGQMLDNKQVLSHQWGYGLAIESDMSPGTSSPCVTFQDDHKPTEIGFSGRPEIIDRFWLLL
jgi:hypothetical protein